MYPYVQGPLWSWSCGSWNYNYLCIECLSQLTLWVRIPLKRGVLGASLCDQVCQWLAAGWWLSPGTPLSSTNKTSLHDITEILLKMALSITTIVMAVTPQPSGSIVYPLGVRLSRRTLDSLPSLLNANTRICAGFLTNIKEPGSFYRCFISLVKIAFLCYF